MSHLNGPPILVDVKEAAALLSLSERKTWQLANDGKLPSIKIGKCRRFCIASLHSWVRDQEASQ